MPTLEAHALAVGVAAYRHLRPLPAAALRSPPAGAIHDFRANATMPTFSVTVCWWRNPAPPRYSGTSRRLRR
jgi:hypothetical protein